ncbi:MAG TPA: flagellar basal body rod protein FlgB [Syntrophorhabdales bacterium]|nr:flagellar basal body rod protein FlgB [Syntrophorhabdales bacterium]
MSLLDLVSKALDVRNVYHKVIAGNIANVDTPGFKEKDIDFKKQLERRMSFSAGNVDIQESPQDSLGFAALDENTVNMETQVMKMTENSMYYDALVQAISKKFSLMRYIINGGK